MMVDVKAYSVIRAIESRYSCRSYKNKALTHEVKSQLLEHMGHIQAGPFGTKSRFKLGAYKSTGALLKRLNTYGFIKGTDEFLIGATGGDTEKLQLEEFGYVLEKIILKATSLGLGTCWMGGTFRKSVFSKMISLKKDEILPAVIAIGYVDDKQRRLDNVVRGLVKASRRRPWELLFYSENFETPLTKEAAEPFSVPLEMLRLAPSASNRQPWKVVKKDDCFHFYLRRTPGYQDQAVLKWTGKADLQRIDIGIAMCHFELTCNEKESTGRWLVHDPNLPLPDELTGYKVSWIGD